MTTIGRVETGTPQCCGGEGFMDGRKQPASGDATAGAGCPMSKMCGGMMKAGPRGLAPFLLIPAGVFLTLGAAILVAPQILAWLVAGGLILAGGLTLVAAYRIRKPETSVP